MSKTKNLNNIIMNNSNNMNMYNPTTDGMNLKDLMKKNELDERGESDTMSRESRGSIHTNKNRKNIASDYSGVRSIANNINNSLKALDEIEALKKNKKVQYTEEDDIESDHMIRPVNGLIRPQESVCPPCMEDTGGMFLLEPLLLVSIYVVMSQPAINQFASKYISLLEPNNDGIVELGGIIIYGAILTSLFLILRRIVYAKM